MLSFDLKFVEYLRHHNDDFCSYPQCSLIKSDENDEEVGQLSQLIIRQQ